MRPTTSPNRLDDSKLNIPGSSLKPQGLQLWSCDRCLPSPRKQVIMRMWWRRNKQPSPEALQAIKESRKALEETQERSLEAEALGAWLRRVRAANHMSERVEALIKASYGEGPKHDGGKVR